MMPANAQTQAQVLKPWLNHSGSITNKLKEYSNAVRLDVLRHEWRKPDTWDNQTLAIDDTQNILHREILMWASTDICWYARTILPISTYQAEEALFSRLTTEALGELIWNHPDIKRISMKHYCIDEHAAEYHFLTPIMHQGKAPLWARLSTFSVQDTYPFYLLEIFLPGLWTYCV